MFDLKLIKQLYNIKFNICLKNVKLIKNNIFKYLLVKITNTDCFKWFYLFVFILKGIKIITTIIKYNIINKDLFYNSEKYLRQNTTFIINIVLILFK